MKSFYFLLIAGSMYASLNTSGYSIQARFPVSGTATWDYITFDVSTNRLFVAHGNQVNVLNAETGLPLGVVFNTPNVHGITIAHELNRGFTSNGGDNSSTIFDLKTLAVIGKVKVGDRPDRIYYNAQTQRVFTCNHGSGDMTVINAQNGFVLGSIPIHGGGEQLVPAPGNLVFVANADTSEIVTFNPRTLKIIQHFPLGPGKEPHGLAYDAEHHRLFAACRNRLLVVLNSTSGKMIASLPIGETVDMAAFDNKTNIIFASNGDGTLSAYKELSADQYQNVGPIQTGPNAKQMDFDARSGRLFLPTGTIMTSDTPAEHKPIRVVKEGTFCILVVAR